MSVGALASKKKNNWGETAGHTERWSLFKNVDIGAIDATLDAAIQPLVSPIFFFFLSSRRRHTRSTRDWSSDVCSSDLTVPGTTTSCAGGMASGGEPKGA